mmetsp:Transcript_15456/g.33412  ORF Transcript_15456/g.33412 Transcript_15456/m.33412 type:complete len:244 (+) Transcript_15456:644-1375(+)
MSNSDRPSARQRGGGGSPHWRPERGAGGGTWTPSGLISGAAEGGCGPLQGRNEILGEGFWCDPSAPPPQKAARGTPRSRRIETTHCTATPKRLPTPRQVPAASDATSSCRNPLHHGESPVNLARMAPARKRETAERRRVRITGRFPVSWKLVCAFSRVKTSIHGARGMKAPVANVANENSAALMGAEPPASSGSIPSSNRACMSSMFSTGACERWMSRITRLATSADTPCSDKYSANSSASSS